MCANYTSIKLINVRSSYAAFAVATPAEQAYSANTFLNLTRAASDKVTRFCRKTTVRRDICRCCCCVSPDLSLHASLDMQAAAPADLVRRLRAKCGTDVLSKLEDGARVPLTAINWTGIGKTAAALYRVAPCACVDFMLGAIKPPKLREQRQPSQKKRKQAPVGPSQAPEQMDTEKQDDSNETSKLTEAMFETVVKNNGRPYAHFVLNLSSFAQTVENMFSIAMLVGNAKVALMPDDEWGMLVRLPGSQVSWKGSAVTAAPAQMVLNMNFSTWKSMCEVVSPDELLTEHRPDIRLANDAVKYAPKAGSSKRQRAQ